MSNTTPTNSPTAANDVNSVDPSLRMAQELEAVFSSEEFSSGTSSPAQSSASPSSASPSSAAPSSPAPSIAAPSAALPSQGIGTVMQSVNSQTPATDLNSRPSHPDERFDQLNKQLYKLDTHFKLINARLDSLDQKVDSLAANKSQATSTPAGQDVTDIVSKLETRFESLENILKAQCETESSPSAISAPAAEAEPAEKDQAEHWQEQKQAMMAKYGFDSEATESQAATPTATPAEPTADQPKADTAVADNPPVATAGTASSSEESATVEELKRQLNSKIREAEVEMSIKRARLMQERVEFERAQAELERRAAKLEAKLAASGVNDNEKLSEADSIMGRFKRHLGN